MGDSPSGRGFRLPDEFVQQFENIDPPFGFNGLGYLVYRRSYSRIKEDGTNEKWFETVRRVVEGTFSIQKKWFSTNKLRWDERKALHSATNMYEKMFHMKFLPPGRGLWAMGSPVVNDREIYMALYSCAFCSTEDMSRDPITPFTFMMDTSMLGVGVGFDTKGANSLWVQKPDRRENPEVFVIVDSREGWVESLGRLLESYFFVDKQDVVFDYSQIRKIGTPIKGFGGTAAGYGILKTCHDSIRNLLEASIDKRISERLIVDLMNTIGKCVISGNIRRCLPFDTVVHTTRGGVPISEIVVGDVIVTAAGSGKVINKFYQGVQDTVLIKHQFGTFECTENHLVAVFDSLGEWKFKRAVDLVNGDRLVFDNVGYDGVHTKLPDYQFVQTKNATRSEPLTIPELDEDVAWLIGLFHGDGYVRSSGVGTPNDYITIACSTDYQSIIDRAISILQRFGVRPKVKNYDTYVKINCYSKELVRYLHTHVKQPKTSITIPDWIRNARRSIRASYLAGVLDSDGSVKTANSINLVSSIYEGFLHDIRELYASLGIAVAVKSRQKAENEKCHNRFAINLKGRENRKLFMQTVGQFSEKCFVRKVGKVAFAKYAYTFETTMVKSWFENNGIAIGHRGLIPGVHQTPARLEDRYDLKFRAYPVEVLEVTSSGRAVETFDIEVDGIHQFTAEGFVTHNSSQIAFGSPDSQEYLDLKNYDVNPERSEFGWSSNNSVEAKLGMDYSRIANRIRLNGEPGLMWLDNMRQFSRMIDSPDNKDRRVQGSNPCLTGDMLLLTSNGYKRIDELWECNNFSTTPTGELKIITRNGVRNATGVFRTGKQIPVLRIKTNSGREIRVTGNHGFPVLDNNGNEVRVDAEKLEVGDKLILNNFQSFGDNSHSKSYDLGTMVPKVFLADSPIDASYNTVPYFIFSGNKNTVSGFLCGMFEACGNGNCFNDKLLSIEFVHGSRNLLSNCQLLLQQFNIKSLLLSCGDKFKLTIVDDLDIFYNEIFKGCNPTKPFNNQNVLIDWVGENVGFTDTIDSIEPDGVEDVYCLTEPMNHEIVVNGIVTYQCGEISLESFEVCNVVEVFPNHCSGQVDFIETLRSAFLYAKTVSLGHLHWQETNKVMLRNRRIGCSLSGIAQFLAKHGINQFKKWCERGYEFLKEYDNEVSEVFAVPTSIKLTTVKPSGSVSLVAGATPGVHYPESRYYIRRVRISRHSDLLLPLRRSGYKIEDAYGDPETVVVEIPVDSGDGVRSIKQVSMWEQLNLASFLQKYWSDNQVSCTVTFDPETEGSQIESALDFFQYSLKSISFLPKLNGGAYPQMPYEEISEEIYHSLLSSISIVDFDSVTAEIDESDNYCTGDKCILNFEIEKIKTAIGG